MLWSQVGTSCGCRSSRFRQNWGGTHGRGFGNANGTNGLLSKKEYKELVGRGSRKTNENRGAALLLTPNRVIMPLTAPSRGVSRGPGSARTSASSADWFGYPSIVLSMRSVFREPRPTSPFPSRCMHGLHQVRQLFLGIAVKHLALRLKKERIDQPGKTFPLPSF